jgi:hypothetical protein
VGPASVMVGNIVQGNRLASAQGRDMGVLDEDSDNAKKVSSVSSLLLQLDLLRSKQSIGFNILRIFTKLYYAIIDP